SGSLAHGDGPAGVAGAVEGDHVVTVLGRPLGQGLGGLGAVEIDHQVITALQLGDRLLRVDQREGAHGPVGLEGVGGHGRGPLGGCGVSDGLERSGAGPGNDRRRARRPQAAGVRTGAGREPAPVARCGRTSRNQAAPQVPSMMATSETQPWELNRAVSTRELPMVQPPARAAPTPISTPPAALRSMVRESGVRQRNSPESLAAAKDPIRMPSTSITDQSTRVTSPVARKVAILAEGVVMPSPPLRPAAVDSTHAAMAIRPSSTPTTQGLQGMSAR